MSVREELEKLSKLQELDLKIDKARKMVSSAPHVLRPLEQEITKETAAFTAMQAMAADLEKQKRQLETEIVMDRDRIKNIESRINSVTNNKEFHAASKESEKAKKLIGDREKMIIDLQQKVEAQHKTVADVQARVETLNKQLADRKNEIGGQVGEADKEISAYNGDRQAIVDSINAPLMSRYNRIRTVYNDALVIVKAGHCASCNVALPPQTYIRVQKGIELITCPNCQRLLYYRLQ